MTDPVGRRDRKRAETAKALRLAALRLVAERGMHRVTVEDIAAAADVSTRTFFNYFPSKEEALIGLAPELISQLVENLAARPLSEPPLEALRAVLREFAANLAESGPEWSLRMEVARAVPELLPRMKASLDECQRSLRELIATRTGTDAERDLYPALVTAVALGVFHAVIQRWRDSAGTLALERSLDQAFRQLAAGLPAPRRASSPLKGPRGDLAALASPSGGA